MLAYNSQVAFTPTDRQTGQAAELVRVHSHNLFQGSHWGPTSHTRLKARDRYCKSAGGGPHFWGGERGVCVFILRHKETSAFQESCLKSTRCSRFMMSCALTSSCLDFWNIVETFRACWSACYSSYDVYMLYTTHKRKGGAISGYIILEGSNVIRCPTRCFIWVPYDVNPMFWISIFQCTRLSMETAEGKILFVRRLRGVDSWYPYDEAGTHSSKSWIFVRVEVLRGETTPQNWWYWKHVEAVVLRTALYIDGKGLHVDVSRTRELALISAPSTRALYDDITPYANVYANVGACIVSFWHHSGIYNKVRRFNNIYLILKSFRYLHHGRTFKLRQNRFNINMV